MKSSLGKILATPPTPPGAWVGLEKPTIVAVLVVRVVGVQDVVEVVEVMNWALARVRMEKRAIARCCGWNCMVSSGVGGGGGVRRSAVLFSTTQSSAQM